MSETLDEALRTLRCPVDGCGERLEKRECGSSGELWALHGEVRSVGGHVIGMEEDQLSEPPCHSYTFHWPTREQYEAAKSV